jgi:hypothetical protein
MFKEFHMKSISRISDVIEIVIALLTIKPGPSLLTKEDRYPFDCFGTKHPNNTG